MVHLKVLRIIMVPIQITLILLEMNFSKKKKVQMVLWFVDSIIFYFTNPAPYILCSYWATSSVFS